MSMTGKGDKYRDDMGVVMLVLSAIAPFDDTLAQHKHGCWKSNVGIAMMQNTNGRFVWWHDADFTSES